MTIRYENRSPLAVPSFIGVAACCWVCLLAVRGLAAASPFTLGQVLSYPFPQEIAASPTGARIAWVFNQEGARNVWVAEGPAFASRRLTDFRGDDGQDLTNLAFSHDGEFVVYVRGGDHDANWPVPEELPPDPASSPRQPKVEVWSAPFAGGAPKLLDEGDNPAVSPRGDRVAFLKNHQVWSAPIDGSQPAARLLFCRGECRDLAWSPDGSELAFVSDRDDHSFIALYTAGDAPIRYLAPSTSRDGSPRRSPDGTKVAFVRRPGIGGKSESLLELHPAPWEIWAADVRTGAAHRVWKSPETLLGSFPDTAGGANLGWTANDQLVFLAELDGWPHLYSVPASAGTPRLLTPGRFMVEDVAMAPDHRSLIFSGNAGGDADDDDRRHLFLLSFDAPKPRAITSGQGLEWAPAVFADGRSVAFIGATAQRPPLPMVALLEGGPPHVIGEEQIPRDFPAAALVTPRKIVLRARDGVAVHCQLFKAAGPAGRKPAIIFLHGGPFRQMLLGWHPMDYYSNAYAVNQYLASCGYVVLSVNYRLGIGYGQAFQRPDHAGIRRAAEYNDVLAAAQFLQHYPEVDPHRIGLWGGSDGGYLTALALARNSDLFAVGVDLHGVHDWSAYLKDAASASGAQYEKNDLRRALELAWKSSPVASVSTWRSPVLLVQGDDDRNVHFHQMVELARRLSAAGVPFEEMVLPDEIHGFLRHEAWVRADSAVVTYLDRWLRAHPID